MEVSKRPSTAIAVQDAIRIVPGDVDATMSWAGTLPGARKFLFMIALSQFLVANDFCSLSVALSTMGRDLAVAPDILQWVVSGCTLAFGGFLILGGRLCDLFPQRRCFLVGITVACIGALISATAHGIGPVIAGRILVGTGGALTNPAILSLTVKFFPEGSARNKALSVFAVAQSIGAVFGLVVGGIITTHLGWRGIFYVDFGGACIALAAARYCLPVLVRPSDSIARPDVLGGILVTAGSTLLVYALSSIGGNGWFSSKVVIAGAASILSLVLFVVVERLHAAPLVPLSLFRRPNFSAAVFVSFCTNAAASGLLILLAMFLQKEAHYTAQDVGLMFLPMAVAATAGGFLIPRLLNHVSPRSAMAGGVGMFCLLMLGMTQIPPAAPFIFSVGIIMIFPLCQMASIIASMGEATGTAPDTLRGVASSILLAGNQIAVAFGLAIIASALQPSAAGIPENFLRAFLASACVPAVGALVALAAIKGRYGQPGGGHHG
jgi:MFS family permease